MSEQQEWGGLLHHESHDVVFQDITIRVEDGVFTPDPEQTYSPWMILNKLPEMDLAGKSVADVGTGSGIIAIAAAKNGPKEMVATDISEEAIENALRNAERNGVTDIIQFECSDLLEEVQQGPFDVIYANLPILNELWKGVKIDAQETLLRFISSLDGKLADDGIAYIPWASFAEDERVTFERMLTELGFTFGVESEVKNEITWYLYIVTKH